MIRASSVLLSSMVCVTSHITLIAAQQPARWTVDAKPIFDLGAESQDTLDTFADVRGVTRLANGDIIVADNKYTMLRYFTAAGAFRRSVGRRGDGPGEFHSIIRMLRCGDSLFVEEWGQPLWHVFDLNGTFSRNVTLATPDPKQSVAYAISCNSRGLFLGDGWQDPKDIKPGTFRSIIPFWLNTSDGKVKKVLANLLGNERVGTTRADGSLSGTGPLPLGKESVLALGRDRAYIGTADSFAILVFDLNGNPLPMIRKPNVDLRTTPADIARYVELDTAGHSPESIKSRLAMQRKIKYPATLPAYSALVVDAGENLWVQSYPRAGERVSHWSVFSPKGSQIASVDLPLNFEASEIGTDYVLGILRVPPDDVQHVVIYKLHRR